MTEKKERKKLAERKKRVHRKICYRKEKGWSRGAQENGY